MSENVSPAAPAKPPKPPTPEGKQRVQFENSKFQMHPDVALLQIPTQTSDEYTQLRDNIEKTGRINESIKMARHPVTKEEFVVDGWHRIHIGDELGLVPGKQFKYEWVDYDNAVNIAASSQMRRNLNDNQRAAFAVRMLAVEKELAQKRQSASVRITNLLRAAEKPTIAEVDYNRLALGGDIAAAFSTETIPTKSKSALSRIKGFFEHDGAQYTIVDGAIGGRMVGYQLMPVEEYRAQNGILTNYATRADEWARGENVGNYDGIMVGWTEKSETEGVPDKEYVRILVGPPVVFAAQAADEEAEEEAETGKGKKGKKAAKPKKNRASEEAAKKSGLSARSIEMAATVEKLDPEAFSRITKGENQPGLGVPETINSAYVRVKAAQAQEQRAANPEADKQESAYPSPDNLTFEEFVANHPLYAQVKGTDEEAAFVDDLRAFTHTFKALRGLKNAIGASKIMEKKHSSSYSQTLRAVMLVDHPYKWFRDTSRPGGYSIKKPKALPSNLAEVSAATAQAAEAEEKAAAPTKAAPKAAPKDEPQAESESAA